MASSRPSDAIDPGFGEGTPDDSQTVTQPRLGPLGWLRFAWRQLTSMRTALLLLLLLALAAIPGSLVPQITSDPNGVIQYKRDNPGIAPVLDALGVFSTYSSVWFSAIYLLLFISLIGCVIPRTKHHWDAMRARPPKTPARLERLPGFLSEPTGADAETAIAEAERMLKRQGYRVERYGDSVSAERGYLRETGNLVFHTALIGVLVAVGVGGGWGYTGQRVLVEGSAFANVLAGYDSFNPGRFFDESQLAPYSIALDDLEAVYEQENLDAFGQPIDFTATVTTTERGQEPQQQTIKVNDPLHIGGNEVYLLGNGYAPVLTIRDADGAVVSEQAVPCRPTDANLTSICVFKVPDGLPEQVGMLGFLYPTVGQLELGRVHLDLPRPAEPAAHPRGLRRRPRARRGRTRQRLRAGHRRPHAGRRPRRRPSRPRAHAGRPGRPARRARQHRAERAAEVRGTRRPPRSRAGIRAGVRRARGRRAAHQPVHRTPPDLGEVGGRPPRVRRPGTRRGPWARGRGRRHRDGARAPASPRVQWSS